MSPALSDLDKIILIADDDEDLKENLTTLIKRIAPKTTCICVADGQGALEAIKARKFDLLILDLLMPKLDGKGLIESLVGIEKIHRPSFLLVISGSIQGGTRRIGKTTFLPKPFSTNEIQNYFLTTFDVSLESETKAETTTKANPELECFSQGVAQTLENLCSTPSTTSGKSAKPSQSSEISTADITIQSTLAYPKSQVSFNLQMEKTTFLRIIARMLGEPHIEIKPELFTSAAEFNSQIVEFVRQGNSPVFKNPQSVIHTVMTGDKHRICVRGNTAGFTESFKTDVGTIVFNIAAVDS